MSALGILGGLAAMLLGVLLLGLAGAGCAVGLDDDGEEGER